MIRMSERAFRYLPPAGALVAEDALIKYARDGGGSTDWNPALHPRTGAPPNPGWFAPTDGASDNVPRDRFAQNHDDSIRPDAEQITGRWVKIPSGKYIDELADFLADTSSKFPDHRQNSRWHRHKYKIHRRTRRDL
jgi:hypothetical protein